MYYGKLESDELATIKSRRYWVNILSPKQSHSAMRRNTDPFSRHLQIAIFEFQKFSFSKWG